MSDLAQRLRELVLPVAPGAEVNGTGAWIPCATCNEPRGFHAAPGANGSGGGVRVEPADCACDGDASLSRAREVVHQAVMAPIDAATTSLRDDKGKIVPPRLARHLANEWPPLMGGSTVYVYRDGRYQPGERLIQRQVRALANDSWTRRLEGEVLGHIRAGAADLDERPPLNRINVTNGIVNLGTHELEPHTPQLRSPVQLPVTYDPDATCPEIDRFLYATLDAEVRLLLLEVAGYLCTPDNRHQRAFLLLGQGGTGKSTTLAILRALLGHDNVSHVALQQLDEHRFATAELYGKLANIHADLPSRAVNGTSAFKCITGGDSVMAERKGRDPFTFRPYSRLVYSANETPPTHDGSEAYFDRWTILPFDRAFRGAAGETRDLASKLTTPTELSGLLNIAIATIPKVRREGFTVGDAVRAAHSQFRLDSDPVAAFLDERAVVDPELRTARTTVFRAYRQWCLETGRSPLAAGRFNNRIRDRHRQTVGEITVNGDRYWSGLGLTGERPQ